MAVASCDCERLGTGQLDARSQTTWSSFAKELMLDQVALL